MTVFLINVVAGVLMTTPMQDMAACTTSFINMPLKESFSARCIDTSTGQQVYARDKSPLEIVPASKLDREI